MKHESMTIICKMENPQIVPYVQIDPENNIKFIGCKPGI